MSVVTADPIATYLAEIRKYPLLTRSKTLPQATDEREAPLVSALNTGASLVPVIVMLTVAVSLSFTAPESSWTVTV